MKVQQQSLFVKEPKQTKIKTIKIVNLKMVREKSVKYDQSISMASDVRNLVRDIYQDSYREIVAVIGINSRNCPTVIHVVGIGSPNQSPVFIPNVIKPLLLSNSIGFILVHNHPSGSLSPSQCDIEITKRCKDAGKLLDLDLVDHIILNQDCSDYVSMRTLISWPH